MTHDELIIQSLAYRRNVGATLDDIRSYLNFREETKHTIQQDLEVLLRLEKAGQVLTVGHKWFFTPAGYKLAKGSALDAEWKFADAWILIALLHSRNNEDCTLAHIIAAADGINHAIPTHEEIHGAINRLLAARLIKIKRDTFSVTDKSLELSDKAKASCKKYVLDQLDGLRRLMHCPCCGVKLISVRWRFVLDEAVFNDAVDSYRKMVR